MEAMAKGESGSYARGGVFIYISSMLGSRHRHSYSHSLVQLSVRGVVFRGLVRHVALPGAIEALALA
jgi:hypothetical protein